MPSRPSTSTDAAEEDAIKVWTAQEVAALRQQQPLLAIPRVLLAQAVLGLVVAAVAGLLTRDVSVAVSAAWGALAVVIPAALFARGLTGRLSRLHAGTAVFAFFLWELVKIVLTVLLLVLAPWVLTQVSWPAMLVAMVLTMKVYWVIWMRMRWFAPQRNG